MAGGRRSHARASPVPPLSAPVRADPHAGLESLATRAARTAPVRPMGHGSYLGCAGWWGLEAERDEEFVLVAAGLAGDLSKPTVNTHAEAEVRLRTGRAMARSAEAGQADDTQKARQVATLAGKHLRAAGATILGHDSDGNACDHGLQDAPVGLDWSGFVRW